MMSNAPKNKNEVKLHPLVDQARGLLEKAAAQAKNPTEAMLTKAELETLTKKVKACTDDRHALGVDFIAQALACHRIHWEKAIDQMLHLAALVLSDDTMKDELSKGASPPRGIASTGSKSTIAGLQLPAKNGAKKAGRR